MRTPIIAGNWKMNTDLEEAIDLAGGVRDKSESDASVERVLIPPFPWIVPVSQVVDGAGIRLGAQNCYSETAGAFTGEVSPVMLQQHCTYVVLGHSERRHILGETDDQVAAKVAAALGAGLDVILCVGETLDQRNDGEAQDVVARQLKTALNSVSESDISRIVVAYEPVWAIGTGVAASTQDAQDMAAYVRSQIRDRFGDNAALAIRIQYGGSVKADNALELMQCPDIDGALVGGASLNADDFCGIIRAAAAQEN
jgi:triosephosphate isomerase (TIM)